MPWALSTKTTKHNYIYNYIYANICRLACLHVCGAKRSSCEHLECCIVLGPRIYVARYHEHVRDCHLEKGTFYPNIRNIMCHVNSRFQVSKLRLRYKSFIRSKWRLFYLLGDHIGPILCWWLFLSKFGNKNLKTLCFLTIAIKVTSCHIAIDAETRETWWIFLSS